uniref:Integrase catalytic domain-containing protein n=1 Tax=Salarias fasciatus TaxID=181472 RepID=A0A672HEM7_SALFA
MWTRRDVWGHVRTCTTCQQDKGPNEKPAGLLPSPDVKTPGEVIGVDFLGPFPHSKDRNSILMVVVDYYSRWVELFAVRDDEILTRWGVPKYLVTDRGPQLTSHHMARLCESWGVTQKLTTAYHPQINMTEGVDHTLKTVMASFVRDHHQDWDKRLPELRLALSTGVHETTGATPAMLALGRELKGPLERLVGRAPAPHTATHQPLHTHTQLRRRSGDTWAWLKLGKPDAIAHDAGMYTLRSVVSQFCVRPVNYQVHGVTAKGKADTVSATDMKPCFRPDKPLAWGGGGVTTG